MITSKKNIIVPTTLFYLGTLIISLTTFRPLFIFLNASDLLYLFSAFTLLIVLLKNGEDPFRILVENNYLLLPLLVFVCGAILSLINSDNIAGGLITILKYLFLFGVWMPFGVYLFSDMDRIKTLMMTLIIASVIPISIGISDFLLGTSFSRDLNDILSLNISRSDEYGERFGSIMGHPNNFGILLSVIFPLSLWMIFDVAGKFKRVLGFFYITVIILSCLITGSRATMLSITIQCVLFPIIFFKGTQKKIGALGLIALLSVLTVFAASAILDLVTLNRLYETMNVPLGEYAPDVERVASLVISWNYIKAHPFIGIGVESAEALTEKLYVHNTIFRLWASIGISGLMASCWFYGICLVTAYRMKKKLFKNGNIQERLILSVIFTSIIGWILVDMVQPQFHNRIKWVMCILLFSLYRIDKAKRSKCLSYDRKEIISG